ncbi:tripartite tricarboxylate transporter TctB family protein [Vibrio sp. UCD-FRSSP16_10]|uniref:tripartite tricarboxylate transporter TctB family protein n=1 Tax=unclassified Vibrio TaxID=2614977 RepID=UPI0007FEBC28|nr:MULTISPECIES: tripartite tricarboxylate transporter TctB family protein [unclassified Vibrio]OBT17213.1 tripartite tricarboxylate transporter TctB family protein [Vibrio sp. UCD-FRSSP16_30]OBT22982.1 tripartite tricarboxylate transporter TctB family protein [Vibrio sp. UCD-FRSSP16_10]
MINRNVVFPSLIIALSAVILVLIGQFSEPRFQDASVDAKFFPTAIAIAQILICIALLIQHKLKSIKEEDQPAIFSKMAVFGVAFLIGYALLINVIGYLFASLVAFTVYLILFKVKKPVYYIVAWTFVCGVYYLFGEVFYIALPEGLFY